MLEEGTKCTSWASAPEDMYVGGRNLLRNSADPSATFPAMCTLETENGENYIKFNQTTQNWSSFRFIPYIPIDFVKDKTITVSFEARAYNLPNTSTASWLYVNPQTYETNATTDAQRVRYKNMTYSSDAFTEGEWVKISYTIPVDLSTWSVTSGKESTKSNYITLCVFNYSGNRIDLRRVKLELGNKATDWTPAPEDVASDIDDASKVAKNYLKFTEAGGLDIGYTGDANAHGKTNIKGDGMRIYNKDDAVNPVASFTANGSQIGKKDGSQIILTPNGQSLLSNNIKWFEVKKSGNPTAEPTDSTLTYNAAKTAVLPNTPVTGTKIVVACDINDEDTAEFTAGTSATKNLEYHAASGWTVYGTITYNASAKSFTYTPKIAAFNDTGIISIEYKYSSNAVDLGIFQFGNRRDGTKGNGSVSMGRGLLSALPNEVAFGAYNESGNNALSIGDGTAQTPHNLFDIKKNGVVHANGVSGAEVGFHANNNNGYGEGFVGWGTGGTNFGVYASGWLIYKDRSTGNVYLNGVNTDTLVTTRVKTISLGTVAANGFKESFGDAPEVTNFQPIGILDYYMSGSGSSYCFPYSVRVDVDTGTIEVGVRNLRESATGSVSIIVKVLYRMNTDYN